MENVSKPIFKIGDTVTIRFDLENYKYYQGCYFNALMSVYRGRVCTIKKVVQSTDSSIYWYYINEMTEEDIKNQQTWVFAEQMFIEAFKDYVVDL
jgi:hypothetical protein